VTESSGRASAVAPQKQANEREAPVQVIPEQPNRVPASATFSANPVVAVLRARDASLYAPVVETLVENGVLSIELTLTTPRALEVLPALLDRLAGSAEIGVGTVLNARQAAASIEAGASFLVTPTTLPDVIHAGLAAGIQTFPGGLTPSELSAGWEAGATAVKLFPASVVGPDYLAQLRGPFPQIPVLPSGGIGIDDVEAWIAAGAVGVSMGGPLIGDALSGGDLTALAERARRTVDIVHTARAAR
jgi:2-dehydro-3-deoxyphosphogluconate aldolase/(4S)-4-hydroxy-2-oxoglutarate aldolase